MRVGKRKGALETCNGAGLARSIQPHGNIRARPDGRLDRRLPALAHLSALFRTNVRGYGGERRLSVGVLLPHEGFVVLGLRRAEGPRSGVREDVWVAALLTVLLSASVGTRAGSSPPCPA